MLEFLHFSKVLGNMLLKVCKLSISCFSNPHSYVWKISLSFLVNALVGSFTLSYIISQLYLYPNGYGVVVLVGLMFATIINFITYVGL